LGLLGQAKKTKAVGRAGEEKRNDAKKREEKSKKRSAEDLKILESLPDPPEFEDYESPFPEHSTTPILPASIAGNPKPLELFNLFFSNDLLAQMVVNTNRYAELKRVGENRRSLSLAEMSDGMPSAWAQSSEYIAQDNTPHRSLLSKQAGTAPVYQIYKTY